MGCMASKQRPHSGPKSGGGRSSQQAEHPRGSRNCETASSQSQSIPSCTTLRLESSWRHRAERGQRLLPAPVAFQTVVCFQKRAESICDRGQ
jgi:hypothetical protein